jgi:hypothetical protein
MAFLAKILGHVLVAAIGIIFTVMRMLAVKHSNLGLIATVVMATEAVLWAMRMTATGLAALYVRVQPKGV